MSGAAQILDASWDRFLAVEPLFATAVGDARFDALLPDPSEAGRAERHRVHTGLLEAAAGIDPRALTRGAADLRAGRGPDAPGAGLVDPPPGPVVGGGAHAVGHRHGPGCCWA